MILYSFVNNYLSQIQKGIQTAHMVSELHTWYQHRFGELACDVMDWGILDKTIIVLNGGNNDSLTTIYDRIFTNAANVGSYPWSAFYEDKESLNGMLTCVGILLPEKFKESEDRQDFISGKIGTEFDVYLAELLNRSKLA
jgi:hypothetical protein